MITAEQNQKFPFHFLSAPPTPPAEEKKKSKENFWVLHTRVRERVRGALVRITTQSERTRQFRATTRSARAISPFVWWRWAELNRHLRYNETYHLQV